jgi:hypothetical protein
LDGGEGCHAGGCGGWGELGREFICLGESSTESGGAAGRECVDI